MNTTKLIVTEKVSEFPKPTVPSSEAGAMLAMIERASRDPAVDVEKMRQLWALRKELVDEESKRAFNIAMNAAQAEMKPIAADATNPQTKSKYASYAQLDNALRPIYTKHGFAISYDEGTATRPDYVMVLGYLSHNGGHTHVYHAEMPADGKGAKGGDVMTKTHAVGAGKSYGKRYILKDAFNIAVGEEDTDGNKPEEHPKITLEQINELEKLIIEVADGRENFRQKFMNYAMIKSMGDILAVNFDAVKQLIESKRRVKK